MSELPEVPEFEYPKDPVVVWIGCDNPVKLEAISSQIRYGLQAMGHDTKEHPICYLSSELNPNGLLSKMKEHDPDFFQKNIRHSYQDEFFKASDKVAELQKALTPTALLDATIIHGGATVRDVLDFYIGGAGGLDPVLTDTIRHTDQENTSKEDFIQELGRTIIDSMQNK